MTVETSYTQVSPDPEFNSEELGKSESPDPESNPEELIEPLSSESIPSWVKGVMWTLTVLVIIGLLSFWTYRTICFHTPNSRLRLECDVMSTSTADIFRCQTSIGHYICTQPITWYRTCDFATYESFWGDCTFIAGPPTEIIPVDPLRSKNMTATCMYNQPACGSVKSLVNMNCCRYKA